MFVSMMSAPCGAAGARGSRDDFRARQHQHIIVAFQVMGVILVTRTSEVILAELVLLHSRTHGAVDDHHAFRDTLDDAKRQGTF